MDTSQTPVAPETRVLAGRGRASWKLRRARCLAGYWDVEGFTVENYLTHRQTIIAPAIVALLDDLENYQSYSSLVARWANVPGIEGILARLLEGHVVIAKDSHLDKKERALNRIWHWGQETRFFHYATNSLDFECRPEVQKRELAIRAKTDPPPSPFTERRGEVVPMHRKFDDQKGGLWNILLARRTCRSYTGQSISRSDLADLLLWTWGRTRTVSDPKLGDCLVKTSPSGGARHPVEVYPVVLAVRNVVPGIYHYSVRRACLTRLLEGDFAERVVSLCSNQTWLRDAAVVFFMTAVLGRAMWKYRHGHAYRVLNLDAGHLGQTFHLVCTQLGLGPFTTAALRNEEIETLLGLDGVSEIVVYAAAVGVPRI